MIHVVRCFFQNETSFIIGDDTQEVYRTKERLKEQGALILNHSTIQEDSLGGVTVLMEKGGTNKA